jgi:chromosomal replication initiation ATPase DnaA
MTKIVQTADAVAIQLVDCDGRKVMIPLHRLARAYVDLQKRPAVSAIAMIKKAVCAHYSITQTEICAARRTAHLVLARQVAMWLARELTTFSLPQIAREFGNRDHTTALHSCRKVDHMLGIDASMRADIELLKARLSLGESAA